MSKMKKITVFFTLIVLISFVSCDTLTRYTMRVSVDRNPVLTIVNQTGHPVVVTVPIARNIGVGGTSGFQPAEPRGTFNVTYTIAGIQFTEQVTMDNADATVTLTRRPPTITVVNNTGFQVVLTDPVSGPINHGARVDFLTPALNQVIPVVYRIGSMNFSEQVTMANQDVTVTLTRRPPIVTIQNQTGHTINNVFIRNTGTPGWGLSILGATGGGVLAGSFVHGEGLAVNMAALPEVLNLGGERFDIRVDDVQGNTYVRNNLLINADLNLPFTQAHRP